LLQPHAAGRSGGAAPRARTRPPPDAGELWAGGPGAADDPGRMDRAPLDRLGVPPGRALADAAPAPARAGLRACAGLSVSHGAGRAHAELGQGRAAKSGPLAVHDRDLPASPGAPRGTE